MFKLKYKFMLFVKNKPFYNDYYVITMWFMVDF